MTLIHFGVDFDKVLYESDTFLVGVCSNVKRYFTKDNAFNRQKEYRNVGLVELDSCIVQVGMLNLIDELITLVKGLEDSLT